MLEADICPPERLLTGIVPGEMGPQPHPCKRRAKLKKHSQSTSALQAVLKSGEENEMVATLSILSYPRFALACYRSSTSSKPNSSGVSGAL